MLIWQLQELKNDSTKNYPEVFAEHQGRCTKTKARFEVKDNVTPPFKPKKGLRFAVLKAINKEMGRLEKLGILQKKSTILNGHHRQFLLKKRNVCTDFSTGLDERFK